MDSTREEGDPRQDDALGGRGGGGRATTATARAAGPGEARAAATGGHDRGRSPSTSVLHGNTGADGAATGRDGGDDGGRRGLAAPSEQGLARLCASVGGGRRASRHASLQRTSLRANSELVQVADTDKETIQVSQCLPCSQFLTGGRRPPPSLPPPRRPENDVG